MPGSVAKFDVSRRFIFRVAIVMFLSLASTNLQARPQDTAGESAVAEVERALREAKTADDKNSALRKLAALATDEISQKALRIDARLARLITQEEGELRLAAIDLLATLPDAEAGMQPVRSWLKREFSKFSKKPKPDFSSVKKKAAKVSAFAPLYIPDRRPRKFGETDKERKQRIADEKKAVREAKKKRREYDRKLAAVRRDYDRVKKVETKRLDAGYQAILTIVPLLSIGQAAVTDLVSPLVRKIYDEAPALRPTLARALVEAGSRSAMNELCRLLANCEETYMTRGDIQATGQILNAVQIVERSLQGKMSWALKVRPDLEKLAARHELNALPPYEPLGGKEEADGAKSRGKKRRLLNIYQGLTGKAWESWFQANESKIPERKIGRS